MSTWIAETVTSDVGWEHLEQLVDIGNRMAGSAGEREAAERTRSALENAGARNARLESFSIHGWERKRSSLTVEEHELTVDCLALPRSPQATVRAPLVDLGYGLPEQYEDADLEGTIVMVRSDIPSYYDRYVHRREKYYHAVENGAVGFVYRNHVDGCLAPTGSVGTPDAPIGEIPAVGVSSEAGARLARRVGTSPADADSTSGPALELAVEATIEDAESQNVHAELGPETDERLLVTSHIDAHDIAEGALDNGAGTAMIVELANALAMREDELETRIEFVGYGAEEVGLVGSTYHSETTAREEIKAIVNNDGVVRARTLSLISHGFETIEDVATDVADQYGHPIEIVPQVGPHSDHWPFVRWGVPGCHVMSTSEAVGRGWGHTVADTLDKLDRRDLTEQAILLTELIVSLARSDVSTTPKSTTEMIDLLEAQDLAEGMRITGDWPYD